MNESLKTQNISNFNEEGKKIMEPMLNEVLAHYTLDEIKAYVEHQKKVFFPTVYGPHWKDHFATKEEIGKLLQDINITDEEIIKIDLAPTPHEDRLTLFVTLKNITSREITKAIIDFISGSPTWAQFIDVTYDSGADTDLKLIIYDDDTYSNPSKPLTHSVHISTLAEKNNRCGVKTYLVHAIFLLEREGKVLNYVIDDNLLSDVRDFLISGAKIVQNETLPTKRQVQEAEFWVEYNYPHWVGRGFEQLGWDFDASGHLGIDISVDDDFRAKASWDEDGLKITLLSDRGPELLYKLWDDAKDIFKKKYGDCPIDLQPNTPDGPGIVVNPIKIPMSEIINMDPEDKAYYGEEAFEEQSNLEWLIEGILAGEED